LIHLKIIMIFSIILNNKNNIQFYIKILIFTFNFLKIKLLFLKKILTIHSNYFFQKLLQFYNIIMNETYYIIKLLCNNNL